MLLGAVASFTAMGLDGLVRSPQVASHRLKALFFKPHFLKLPRSQASFFQWFKTSV